LGAVKNQTKCEEFQKVLSSERLTGQKNMRFNTCKCTGVYTVKTNPKFMYEMVGSELTITSQE